jgi:GNAT acetyltransferase-like protein
MGRLVEALNTCWLPHAAAPGGDPGLAPLTLADFKRDIRERHVWCSSCMIAFEGSTPIGVLIGAKRATETLIDRIAVRPDRLRNGHGRHMLDSLGAKLAILGPQRMVAEIPVGEAGAATFFEACGFRPESDLTDWIRESGGGAGAAAPGGDRFVVPVTVADLAANGLLHEVAGSAWDRATPALVARAAALHGLAVATVDRISSFVLYRSDPAGGPGATIDSLGPVPCGATDDDLARWAEYGLLLSLVGDRVRGPLRFPRLTEAEIPGKWLRGWSFRPGAGARRYVAHARSE